ncbi:MAG: Mut7-C RNAse domain-containing protein [Thermofilum sp.]
MKYRLVIVDGMLGKLARWLRMLGVPALYKGVWGDEELLELARGEGVLLLTRDKELARKARSAGLSALLLPQAEVEDLLAVVLPALGREPVFDQRSALCPLCGSALSPAGRDEVARRVPQRVLAVYSEFYMCTKCGQVYWAGSHMRQIEATLERVRRIAYGKIVC